MTDHESLASFDNDPVARSSKHRRLIRATRQLADLLNEAQPLIRLLNSPETTHPYRATLRELVGREAYFQLTNHLHQMCSMAAWELAHSKEASVWLRRHTYRHQ